MTRSRIEPATFRLIAQCFNYATACPHASTWPKPADGRSVYQGNDRLIFITTAAGQGIYSSAGNRILSSTSWTNTQEVLRSSWKPWPDLPHAVLRGLFRDYRYKSFRRPWPKYHVYVSGDVNISSEHRTSIYLLSYDMFRSFHSTTTRYTTQVLQWENKCA